MQEKKKNKSATKNLRIGFVGLEFSERILSKYAFFRKSGKLPTLIFLKLFSNKIESGKIKPYHNSKSIINYFRFHLSFYFGIARKSMGISGVNPIEHISYIIEFVEPHLQLSENELKFASNSVKKIGSKKYITVSSEQRKAFEFLKNQGKKTDTLYNFTSVPGIFQSYGSKSDSFKISGLSGSSTSIGSQYVQTNSTAGKKLNFNSFPEFRYLYLFRQMMLQRQYKPGKNYSNLLLSMNKVNKDINYLHIQDWHSSSYHFSYLMTGHATIALSPAASGYTGLIRQNPAIPVVMRKMNNEINFSGSLSVEPMIGYSAIDNSAAIRTYNLTMNQNRIIQDKRHEHIRDSDRHDSSHHFSYLMTGHATTALSPAASGYLQRYRHPENTESIQQNPAMPVVMRKMNDELSFPGSLSAKPAKVYSVIDDSAAAITDNLPVNQNGIIQDIRNRHVPGSDRHNSSYHFSHLLTVPAKIALSPAASGYLQRNRHLENTGSIRYDAASPVVLRKMNKEPGFSGSSPHQSENISLVRLNGQNKTLNFRNLTDNNTYNPSGLVLKRTSLQETETLTRNTQEKTASTRITDHSAKDSIRERPINEINRIADRVYHIIERKISIEKDRRGLL
jgi:hypothetical protein